MVIPLLGNGARREPADCAIRIDGEEIVDLYPFLVEVEVECSRREASVASLRFESRRDEGGTWTVQDHVLVGPWKQVEIEAVFGSVTEEVVRGYVREVKAEYPEDAGAASVTLECQDDSIRLDRVHVREAWGGDAPTDDASILSQVLRRNGLAPHPESGTGQTGLVLNQDGTDIDFLRKRAEANGYELIFREGRCYFGPMRLGGERQATILVYAGRATNCRRFAVKSRGDQPDRVSFDVAPSEGAEPVERIVEPNLPLLGLEPATSDDAGLGEFTWRMVRQGGADEAELERRAQHKANELSLKVEAEGELDGSLYGHVLMVGRPVGVDGVGDRLGGVYYVDSVTHTFDADGYRQGFKLLRNAYGDNLSAGVPALAGVL